jgi:subtilisin family serine protease
MKTQYALAICALLILTSCQKEPSEITEQSSVNAEAQVLAVVMGENGSDMVPNEMLVKFKKGTSGASRGKALNSISAAEIEHIHTNAMKDRGDVDGIYLLHTSLKALEAVSKLKSNSDIEYAEPNYIYQHSTVSNDSYFLNNSMWGMNGTYGCNASLAWANNHTGSNNVYIGVIDEGAMYAHEDLAGNFWTNPFDPADGIDNDANGYIDDVRGWDFNSNDNTTYDGSADDHGTHVSGTIGAKGGNGKGVVGINWMVTLISAKFLGSRGGTTANAIKALDYITSLKTRHALNIVATNNSWGGGGYSQGLYDAIERANAANILFVAAAGNGGSDGVGDNNDITPNYPSNYTNSNVIAVAALTSSGALASYSNYGATTVDIGAPGSGIWSTLPGNGQKNAYSYGSYSGTSMATPHVTGACALYASTHPGTTAADIKAAILNSVTSTSSLNGKVATGSRLNVSGF